MLIVASLFALFFIYLYVMSILLHRIDTKSSNFAITEFMLENNSLFSLYFTILAFIFKEVIMDARIIIGLKFMT